MPFLQTDGTTDVVTGVTANTSYDYNLALKNIYGLSIQAVFVVTGFTGGISLQCSNDGENFVDIPGSLVTITGDGSEMWNLGTPFYKIVRVKTVVSAGSIDLTLIFNAVNLA